MDVSESEYNAYYSLDSQRDFEDFCEADIRRYSVVSRSAMNGGIVVGVNQLTCRFQLHKIPYKDYMYHDYISFLVFCDVPQPLNNYLGAE